MPTSAKLPFAIRQRLKIQHTAVEDMVAPLSAPDLQERVIPTKWSIHTHLAHLGRYQVVFESRLDRILTEEKPTLDRYIAENDPLFIKWKEASWEENWKQLKRDRRHLITRLFALTAEGHHSLGVHPVLGTMHVIEWTEFFLLHEAHHLMAIFRLSKNLQKANQT